MQTSLRGIAEKSALHRDHRFQNLMGRIDAGMLHGCWRLMNRKSAPGVDRVTYWQYGERLTDHIANPVERVKRGCYRAKLVLRRFIPKPGRKTSCCKRQWPRYWKRYTSRYLRPAALDIGRSWEHWMRSRRYLQSFSSEVSTIL